MEASSTMSETSSVKKSSGFFGSARKIMGKEGCRLVLTLSPKENGRVAVLVQAQPVKEKGEEGEGKGLFDPFAVTEDASKLDDGDLGQYLNEALRAERDIERIKRETQERIEAVKAAGKKRVKEAQESEKKKVQSLFD